MKYLEKIKNTLQKIKTENITVDIFDNDNNKIGTLEPMNYLYEKDPKVIELLMLWRNNALYAYLDQRPVTLEGTGKWFESAILNNDVRLLFFVKDLQGDFIGHIGLYTFDKETEGTEIDNVLRGKPGIPGIMTMALLALIDFAYKNLEIKNLYLRVISNNTRAIELYRKNKFIDLNKIPLYHEKVLGYDTFKECSSVESNTNVHFLKMQYIK